MDKEFLFNPIGSAGGEELITQNFGENPAAYARFGLQGHNGVDLGVPEGTAIRCMANTEGEVIDSCSWETGGKYPALGIWCKIQHQPSAQFANGYCTLYAHLSRLAVHNGNRVSPGQFVGLSGNTGNSTGPHLHVGLQPLPRQPDGWGGYVDLRPLISWVSDPMQAYISKWNPHRKEQGLPPLPDTAINQWGEDSEYGRLSPEQERDDRQKLDPGTPFKQASATRDIYRILPEMRAVVTGTKWEPLIDELTAICAIESGNRIARLNGGRLVSRFEKAQWERLWPDTPIPAEDTSEKCYVTSWGAAQIMGWGFAAQGRQDALDFKRWMEEDGQNEFKALLNFLEAKGLYATLKRKDWVSLAVSYNGIAHARNNWVGKFEGALQAVQKSNPAPLPQPTPVMAPPPQLPPEPLPEREPAPVRQLPPKPAPLLQGALEVKPEDDTLKGIAKIAAAWITKAATRGTLGLGLLAGLWQMQPVQDLILSGIGSPVIRQMVESVVAGVLDTAETDTKTAPLPTFTATPISPPPTPTATELAPTPTTIPDSCDKMTAKTGYRIRSETDYDNSNVIYQLEEATKLCLLSQPAGQWREIAVGPYQGKFIHEDAFGE